MPKSWMVALGVIMALLLVAMDSVFIINPRQQGLILRFGEFRRLSIEPGIYAKIPVLEKLTIFDRRVLDYDAEAQEVPTIDQKQLVVDALARYQIIDPLLFRNRTGDEARFRLRLANIIESQLRSVIGRVPLARVLTEERAGLMREITENVATATLTFGVRTLDVRVKRIDLPQANSVAIFNRMRTQREQEARKIRAEGKKDAQFLRSDADKEARVVLSEARRRADIVRGEGEGQAQAIYNTAYGRDQKFFDFYRSLQAYEAGLKAETTTIVAPPDSEFFRFFNQDGAIGVEP